jgi:hypothetical protein
MVLAGRLFPFRSSAAYGPHEGEHASAWPNKLSSFFLFSHGRQEHLESQRNLPFISLVRVSMIEARNAKEKKNVVYN